METAFPLPRPSQWIEPWIECRAKRPSKLRLKTSGHELYFSVSVGTGATSMDSITNIVEPRLPMLKRVWLRLWVLFRLLRKPP